MFAQWERGPALKYNRVPTPYGLEDSAAQREKWFLACLRAIDTLPIALPSIAFPEGIGRGLAAGSWPNYLGMVVRWAAEHPDTAVSVCSLMHKSGPV